MQADGALKVITDNLAADIMKLLDGDWIADEIDNRLIDFGDVDPESAEGNKIYDQQVDYFYRAVTLGAVAQVLTQLATVVPNP